MSIRRASLGLSLIEVVIFIVVLGVGFAAMLAVYNRYTEASVDPIVRKQALAIATSLMEEIQLKPYTFCDPDDANVYTAAGAFVGANGCAALAEGPGKEPGETRYADPRFDNVSDYDGMDSAVDGGIRTADGTAVPALAGYRAQATVEQIAANDLGPDIPPTEALRITVTVNGPAGLTVRLQGYRIRYAPNTP